MNRRHGFTLIELMIVMVIMGILSMIGITGFMSSQVKGRDTARKGDLNAIAQALELYYNDRAQYPSGDADGTIVGCGGGSETPFPTPPPASCPPKSVWKDKNNTVYMASVPKDPSATQSYFYLPSKSTGSSTYNQYQLYAHLENDNVNSHDLLIITPSPASTPSPNCGKACNYGVSSANIQP